MVFSRKLRVLILAAAVATFFFFVFSSSHGPAKAAAPAPAADAADKDGTWKSPAQQALNAQQEKQLAQKNVKLVPEDGDAAKKAAVADSGAKGDVKKAAAGEATGSPASKDEAEAVIAVYDAQEEYERTISKWPIVIFSKSYCPHSKFAKQLLLQEYTITPAPVVVELDLHENGAELQQYIGQVTGRRTVPNIHVMGKSRGGADDFRALKADDKVVPQLLEWANAGLYKNEGSGAPFTIELSHS